MGSEPGAASEVGTGTGVGPSARPPARARWSRLGYRLAMLIAGLLVVTALVTAVFSVTSLRDTTTRAAEESMANSHRNVADRVADMWSSVQAERAAALEARKSELADLSAAVVAGVDRIRTTVSPDGTNDAAAQQAALAMLRGIRYRSDDYFFTLDRDLNTVEHPNPEFDQRPMADFAAPDGRLIFQEMRDLAFGPDGQGFLQYDWPRLGADAPLPKISFVQRYAPWDWIIGSGVYLDDIEAQAAARLEATRQTLSETFARLRYADAGFFFVLDGAGQVVVAPAGRDLGALSSTPWGTDLVGRILATAAAGDGSRTELSAEVPLRGGDPEPWLLAVSRFDELDWVLVSAVPRRELERPGQDLVLRQLLLSAIVLLTGLAIGLLASRRIVRPVEAMTAAALDLESGRFDPSALDVAAARTDEVGALARAFRRMGTEVVERERQLRDEVERLHVVIDRGRVERDVQEITDSDFFQDLQARAKALRDVEGGPGDRA